jgi:hypothetical protein
LKALGRLGGLKGGKARAEKLSPERRSEIAKKGAQSRWAKAKKTETFPKATHAGTLTIGSKELPCYVLEDGRRALAQRGMVDALGMSRGSSSVSGGDRLAKFASGKAVSPFLGSKLRLVTEPFRFTTPSGPVAYGYEATILADLCDAVLAARQGGKLQKQQLHIAEACEVLIRGFARVGIIALVDEATGFQYDRARKALAEIPEQFISKELVKYSSMFTDDFYREMFRLRGWHYQEGSTKRPIHAAKLTIDLVYARLAPGVLEELKRLTPRDEKGRLKHKLFRRLTGDFGHPRLREHLKAVTHLMMAFDDWRDFYRGLQRSFPRYNENLLLDLKYAPDENGEENRG